MTGYRVNADSVDSLQLDGQAVLLNLETHGYFGLNPAATAVWELVKTNPGVPSDDIVEVLARRFGRETDAIAPDVVSLIDDLLRHRLVAECAAEALTPMPVEPSQQSYLAPALQAYGDLDTLILSGE
ncbi:MAG: PqqD family protein [Vicinamibacterales bacterium]